MRTITERIIASSETIMVSNPKGKGSKIGAEGISPLLMAIQIANQAMLRMRKAMLPKRAVMLSATFSEKDRLAWALA